MKALWNRAFELFRRHIVLWVPCSIAAILMLVLAKLERAEIRWLVQSFATQHSVLGGEVPTADPSSAQHRAMLVVYPSSFLKYLLEVWFFVIAFATTGSLVRMILNEQRPDIADALRRVRPRLRAILLFSLQYIAVLAVFGGLLIALGTSPLASDSIHGVALSRPFVYGLGLVEQACLAWLLVPAAVRLLQLPGAPAISTEARRLATAFAVAASACSIALGFLIGRAQSALMLDAPWESQAVSVVNTLVLNVPEVLLFIVLALLAFQTAGEESPLAD